MNTFALIQKESAQNSNCSPQSGLVYELGLHLTLALCHKFARRGHLSIKLHCSRLITQIDNMFNCHFIIYSMGECISGAGPKMDTVLNELMSVGIHECCVMLAGCRTSVCVCECKRVSILLFPLTLELHTRLRAHKHTVTRTGRYSCMTL